MLVDRVLDLGREKGWRRTDVTAPLGDEWHRTVNFYLREGFVHARPKRKKLL